MKSEEDVKRQGICSQAGINYTQQDAIQEAIANGIIDMDMIQEQLEMRAREKYLKMHRFKLWQGKNGEFYTYFPADNDKGRVLKHRKSKEMLEDEVISYYKRNVKKDTVTFKIAYDRWFAAHSLSFKSENTVVKYASDYRRYFENQELEMMPVSQCNEENIRVFILATIKRLGLCKKAAKTLFGYVNNTFKSAVIHKDIPVNPCVNMMAKEFYSFCTERIKTAQDQTVSDQELKALYEQFDLDYQNIPNYIPVYAVEFATLTGMRVSEIVALKWSDVSEDSILVCRSEKHNRMSNEFYIGETKNQKIRQVPLIQETKDLLEMIRTVETEYGYLGEYIFSDEGGRIHAPKISACIKNKCRQVNIPLKSIHSFRRTLSSKLKCHGVPTIVVSSILGHTEQVNDKYYTFDVTSMEHKQNVLSSVNNKIITNFIEEKRKNGLETGKNGENTGNYFR